MKPKREEHEERCDTCGRAIFADQGRYRIGAVVKCSECGDLEIKVTDCAGL